MDLRVKQMEHPDWLCSGLRPIPISKPERCLIFVHLMTLFEAIELDNSISHDFINDDYIEDWNLLSNGIANESPKHHERASITPDSLSFFREYLHDLK